MQVLHKSLFILVMLLALTSQSITATTMFCAGDSSTTQESSLSMEGHKNHSMNMTMDDQDVPGDMGCCDSFCQCFAGSCNFSIFNSSSLNDVSLNRSYIQSSDHLVLERTLKSLYKPPIFR